MSVESKIIHEQLKSSYLDAGKGSLTNIFTTKNWGYLSSTSIKHKIWSKAFHNNAATEVNERGETQYIVQTFQNRQV